MEQKLTVVIDQMPSRGALHWRAHSDTTFRFDDLLLFETSDLDLSSLYLPTSSSNPTPPPVITFPTDSSDNSSSNSQPSCSSHGNPRHISSYLHSLSVDSDFFDGIGLTGPIPVGAGDEKLGGKVGMVGKRAHHRHNNSMDGSFEVQSLIVVYGIKTTIASDRLVV